MLFSKRDLLRMVLPMMLQQVLAITVSTADSMMVASAGEAAVSGVSLVGTLDVLLITAFSSLVTGGTVTVSHALGGGNRKYARDCAKQLIYVSTGIALAIAVLVSIFRQPILTALYGSAEADVLASANSYLAIMVLSFPFLALYSSGESLFRIMGKTTVGLWLSVVANLLNVVGNAVLIYGFHMGAAGAAASTLAARMVCAVIVMIKLHNQSNEVYIDKLFSYRPNREAIRKILRIGVPHGIESSMFQFGRLATQMLISTMGTAGIAANSVANTLANYLYMPSTSLSNAAIAVVGRCYGAGEKKQAKKNACTLMFWEYLCMWALSALLFALGVPIIGLYHLSAEGAQIAWQLTVFHCICSSLIRPPAFILPSVFKATGRTRFTMIVSTASMWIMRVGLSYVFAPQTVRLFGFTFPGLGMGIMGVWVAMAGDWVVRAALYGFYFIRNTWLKEK